jgi:hypothetical protein
MVFVVNGGIYRRNVHEIFELRRANKNRVVCGQMPSKWR